MLTYQHVLISLVVWVAVLGLALYFRNQYLTDNFCLFCLVSLMLVLVFGVLIDVDHFNINNLGSGFSCAMSTNMGSFLNRCDVDLNDEGFLHSVWFLLCVAGGLLAWCVHMLVEN